MRMGERCRNGTFNKVYSIKVYKREGVEMELSTVLYGTFNKVYKMKVWKLRKEGEMELSIKFIK